MRLWFTVAATYGPCEELGPIQLPVVLGRGENAMVRLRDCWVSRRHCEITEDDGELVLRDLGATHGTFVNDVRVTEAKLRPGDRIGLGMTVMRIQRADNSAWSTNVAAGIMRVCRRHQEVA
jgi:predicted component of type VI protein secretion system